MNLQKKEGGFAPRPPLYYLRHLIYSFISAIFLLKILDGYAFYHYNKK